MLPKQVKHLTVEEVKEGNPEVYNSIFNVGKTESTNSNNRELNILRYGIRMNQVELAEKLIKEDISEIDVKTQIFNKASEVVENQIKEAELKLEAAKVNFEKSAPPAAGSASETQLTIETQEQAIDFCLKRDNKGKPEAVRAARREHPEFFNTFQNKETK